MKIGFFGNINNRNFMLAREFRKMGHEVVFIIHYKKNNHLHRPEYRYEDINYPYPEWIHEIILPKKLKYIFSFNNYTKKITSILNSCQLVFLNETGFLFGNFLNKKKVVIACLATGADLDVAANYLYTINNTFKKNNLIFFLFKIFFNLYSTFLIRKGLKKSKLISYFPEGINFEGDRIINKLSKDTNIIRYYMQLSEIHSLRFSSLPNNKIPVFFSATRFEWGKESKILQKWSKGNNIMIKGISLFYKKTNQNFKLNLVEKGSSLDATKKLISQEGIEKNVYWHKEMTQKDIYKWYMKSDIIFEQMGNHMIAMAGLDAMAIGRPVIGNARNDIFEKIFFEKYAVCNASNPEMVCSWIELLVSDEEKRKKIALEGRKFVEKYFSAEVHAKKLMDLLSKYLKFD